MLKVYNTLTRSKEIFKPIKENHVSIYVCGVTPYNDPHIGNARPFVTWDVIKRYFTYLGYNVFHVQNFTDVDDKIINTANKEGILWSDISKRYIESYFEVMDKLNIKRADIYPKVSDNIEDIIKMIEKIIENGYAYEKNGDVYFSVLKFENYGKLSGRKLEDMQAGARVSINEEKSHPMDFALWKKAKTGEPSWSSPWGEGRPGWHIECSTMSLKYLGNEFDFHGGGSDLIFPHHENEIAQSESYCNREDCFAHYWLHNGFITINEEKMSKSLGNFFTVKEILEKYPPEILRFFIISTHYRSPLDFSDQRLEEATASYNRLFNAYENLLELDKMDGTSECDSLEVEADKIKADFIQAMNDDFNTALAIGSMFEMAKIINIYHSEVVNNEKELSKINVSALKSVYLDMANILGIFEQTKDEDTTQLVTDLMDIIIGIRKEARENKNYALADKIRDDLNKIGITLLDTPQGVKWKK